MDRGIFHGVCNQRSAGVNRAEATSSGIVAARKKDIGSRPWPGRPSERRGSQVGSFRLGFGLPEGDDMTPEILISTRVFELAALTRSGTPASLGHMWTMPTSSKSCDAASRRLSSRAPLGAQRTKSSSGSPCSPIHISTRAHGKLEGCGAEEIPAPRDEGLFLPLTSLMAVLLVPAFAGGCWLRGVDECHRSDRRRVRSGR